MLEIYWGCLIFGVIFAVVTLLFGDVLHSALSVSPEFSFDHLAWLQSMVVVGGITSFGGAGVLLTGYTELTGSEVIMLSLFAAIVLSVLVYFVYVKPMRNCENSSGFFITDLIGKTGEVIVLIPAGGFGEVLIRIGAGNTNQTAASHDKVELPAGTRVVVAEIREGVLYVCRNNEQGGGGTV
ncbi:protease [Sporomusa sp.]|uniref:NfeD family protein n=1 Tax=Sporomusa sp. TaxID=2078658 RepID=UPI002C3C61EC|nr:protease [Sporomusa sp.]HWR41921.1 protease [Sporomusa sp.]